jgi:hypothetical protein
VFLALLAVTATGVYGQDEIAWPRQMDGDGGEIVLYQPQIESYSGNVLSARAAVSLKPAGSDDVVFGAIWFEARMSTDLDNRTIWCENLKVTAAKFPTVEESRVQNVTRYLEQEIPRWEMVMDLDRFLAGVEDVSDADASVPLNMDPPEIIIASRPTVLVLIDGDPILADMEGFNLQYVANTPYFIAKDGNRYYLKGGELWYTTGDLAGEWKPAGELPSEVQKVDREITTEEQKQAAEQASAPTPDEGGEDAGDSPVPNIVVRTGPAELVTTDGEPRFVPLDSTQTLYVENSETDILMDMASQRYYILLSGRWYTSASLDATGWSSVHPDDVPVDFANIGAESDMAQVRSSVPGTIESREAILENQIPQTAEVDRKTATVEVTYDGDPKFEKCGESIAYALNTDKAVFLIDGTYYCCDEAIWFVAGGPSGPWQTATSVPPQIQEIPPDCPHYNVRYVYIYDSTPDVVYVGYTPGYTCSYVYYGTVVYGTGYWYRPWYSHYYYPRPCTWGFRAHWNPYTGWGFSFGVSYGWLHIRVGRPAYGGWWGPAGYRHGYRHGYHRGYRHGYHHGARAGYRAGYKAGQQSGNRNVYASNRKGVTTKQKDRATTRKPDRSGTTAKKTPRTTDRKNDVYADRNGDVYKKQGDEWQKKDKSGWSGSKDSRDSHKNLDRDRSSRQRGADRSRQQQSSRSRGGGGGKRRR